MVENGFFFFFIEGFWALLVLKTSLWHVTLQSALAKHWGYAIDFKARCKYVPPLVSVYLTPMSTK